MAHELGELLGNVVGCLILAAPWVILGGIILIPILSFFSALSWFKLLWLLFNRSTVAQSVEHSAVNRTVVGSSPTRGATLKKTPKKKVSETPIVSDYRDEFNLPESPFTD
tara:strand:- start:2016 stop:2345 length:330 start_codon:yes stop_codon:yes gene_type:complete